MLIAEGVADHERLIEEPSRWQVRVEANHERRLGRTGHDEHAFPVICKDLAVGEISTIVKVDRHIRSVRRPASQTTS